MWRSHARGLGFAGNTRIGCTAHRPRAPPWGDTPYLRFGIVQIEDRPSEKRSFGAAKNLFRNVIPSFMR
ncbi:hypothetical protein HMPREF9123_2915 [Neisseria bacilliformis ATCC BAA-1200]|uniref:Uncharacterized protein n=1 Tax=Neisseria bacilliformis ATCC BAA-1200 TaxID=888742 RepID=F2BGQ8_9NEIS|nr:hypothetical protein HMPREF9123_2915 [Neisseria bacilliformis ATCC BAA-1200]